MTGRCSRQSGGPRTRVLQVRLNDDELAAVESLAAKRDLPPSTVVREMILDVLHPTAAQAAARRRLVGEFENYLDRLRTPTGDFGAICPAQRR